MTATDKRSRQNHFLAYLKQAAYDSLMDEVSATPKPGLVDLHDSGAHRDMDHRTFSLSSRAIVPYLEEMAGLGLHYQGPWEVLFARLRPVGMEAEKAMFDATGGVNTHKGILFSMGLTAAAAGSVFAERMDETRANGTRGNGTRGNGTRAGKVRLVDGDDILSRCSKLCRKPLEQEFRRIAASSALHAPRTHGEYLFVTYGFRGIRGEAADGFPSIRTCSLPALRTLAALSHQQAKTVRRHHSWNDICLQTLLLLMAQVDDTNVLYRSGGQALSYVRDQAKQLLHLGGGLTEEGKQGLIRANLNFIEKNISPGGCADLLALTLFLWRLEQYEPMRQKQADKQETVKEQSLWHLTEL